MSLPSEATEKYNMGQPKSTRIAADAPVGEPAPPLDVCNDPFIADYRTVEERDRGVKVVEGDEYVSYLKASHHRFHGERICQVRVPDGLKSGDYFELQNSAHSRTGVVFIKVPCSCYAGDRFYVRYRLPGHNSNGWFAEVPIDTKSPDLESVHQEDIFRKLDELYAASPALASAFDHGYESDYQYKLVNYLMGDRSTRLNRNNNQLDDGFCLNIYVKEMRLSEEGRHFRPFNRYASRCLVRAVDEGRVTIKNPYMQREYSRTREEMYSPKHFSVHINNPWDILVGRHHGAHHNTRVRIYTSMPRRLSDGYIPVNIQPEDELIYVSPYDLDAPGRTVVHMTHAQYEQYLATAE